jgi:hypothetical protein
MHMPQLSSSGPQRQQGCESACFLIRVLVALWDNEVCLVMHKYCRACGDRERGLALKLYIKSKKQLCRIKEPLWSGPITIVGHVGPSLSGFLLLMMRLFLFWIFFCNVKRNILLRSVFTLMLLGSVSER